MEDNIKQSMEIIKQELLKLKDVKDEKVKMFCDNVTKAFDIIVEEKVEDKKQEMPKVEEKPQITETPVTEVKPVEEKKETKELSADLELAKWTVKYINSLPDSSFIIIEPDYIEGKTKDKNARHLPYKDAEGNVDMDHLRNALARVSQLKAITKSITTEELISKAMAKLEEVKKEYMNKEVALSAQAVEKEGIELSLKVSEKLKEASIELTKFKNELATKDELLKVKDKKIVELSDELNKYKEVEKIELEKAFDNKITKLISLYKDLGITKNKEEIKLSFNEEQIDKLTIDLSAMIPSKVRENIQQPKRQTNLSVDLELSKNTIKQQNKEMSAKESAEILFNML